MRNFNLTLQRTRYSEANCCEVNWQLVSFARTGLDIVKAALAILFVPLLTAGGQVCRVADQAAQAKTVPVTLDGGGIFVPVSVNGRAFDFLLDSGFEESVLDNGTVNALHLTSGSQMAERAPGGTVQTSSISDVHRSIAGTPLSDIDLKSLDLSGVASFFGHHIDGVLGFDFFKQFVVVLDYEGKTLTLCEPARVRSGIGHEAAVNLASKQPYISASISPAAGKSAPASLEIDTGKVDPFSINADFARKNGLLDEGGGLLKLKGVSLGGESNGWMSRGNRLTFAGFDIKEPVIGIIEENADRAGQIGYGLLRQFTITFDYERSRIFLQPNSHFGKRLEFDHAGLILAGTGPDLRTPKIFMVIADTPAARAGLHDGDEIEQVDHRSMTLDKARTFFENATGEHDLSVKRGRETLTIRVQCRPLL